MIFQVQVTVTVVLTSNYTQAALSQYVLFIPRTYLVRTAFKFPKYLVRTCHLCTSESGTPFFGICLEYAWNIPHICIPPSYAWYIRGISLDMIPCISIRLDMHGICFKLDHDILGYTMYIPWIYHVYPSSIYIVYPWIYMVYHWMYIHGICGI
jgi:hypothetical protein